jgi:hypothetical protein
MSKKLIEEELVEEEIFDENLDYAEWTDKFHKVFDKHWIGGSLEEFTEKIS